MSNCIIMMRRLAEQLNMPVDKMSFQEESYECSLVYKGNIDEVFYESFDAALQRYGFDPISGRAKIFSTAAFSATYNEDGMISSHRAVFERATSRPDFKFVIEKNFKKYSDVDKNEMSIVLKVVNNIQ